MKVKVVFATLFLLLHSIIIDPINPIPFDNLTEFFIPFDVETGNMKLMMLLLQLGFCIAILNYMKKLIDMHFEMITYTMTRTSLKKLGFIITQDIYLKLSEILFIKLVVSLLFSHMNAFEGIDVLIIITVSLFFSVFLWIELFLILKLKLINSNIIYLLLFGAVVISYALIDIFFVAHILIIGSFQILDNSWMILSTKMIALMILFGVKLLLFKKYERLGVDVND